MPMILAAGTRVFSGTSNKTIKGLYSVFTESEIEFVRYPTQIKPISYVKSTGAEVLLTLNEQRRPLIITQNGEAKAVLQDLASYEETQETMALLKMVALGNLQLESNNVKPVTDVVRRLRSQFAPG